MSETNCYMIQSHRKFSSCMQILSGIHWTCIIKFNLLLASDYQQTRSPKECSENYRVSIKLNFSLLSQIEFS